jgi:hypothetical protein
VTEGPGRGVEPRRRLLIELASALFDDGQAKLADFVWVLDGDCSSDNDVRVTSRSWRGGTVRSWRLLRE